MEYYNFSYPKLYSYLNSQNCVLLGESTHGTADFYDIRLNITKYLIKRKHFSCVFLEMEWSLGVRMNKLIHSSDHKIQQFLDNTIVKYPKWMINNIYIKKLLQFCQKWNQENVEKVYIYGVDCQDIDLAKKDLCMDKTIHCKIVRDIIANYDIMRNSDNYWNLRDSMWEKIIKRVNCGKFILWAHNSHIGDSTAYLKKNQTNIGELLRKCFYEMLSIGFTTNIGKVTASDRWNGKAKVKMLNPVIEDSFEYMFSDLCTELNTNRIIIQSNPSLSIIKYLRYIGVSYVKEKEIQAHYKKTDINKEFDLIVHVENSCPIKLKK